MLSDHIIEKIKKKQWLRKVLPGIDIPTDLKYTHQHIWIRLNRGVIGTVGMTDFYRFTYHPQHVWVDRLPQVDSMIKSGQIVSKMSGLVNLRMGKRLYPKGSPFLSFPVMIRDGRGVLRDVRKRIHILVPSPVSGRIIARNRKLLRKGREWKLIRPRQEFDLIHPYGRYSWLFQIELNERGMQDFLGLMGDTTYRHFVGSILIGSIR